MNPYIPFVHGQAYSLETLPGLFSNAELDEMFDGDHSVYGETPLTVRWLKDDKTALLYSEKSLHAMGIAVKPDKAGLIKTSKRLSRVFRPSRFFASFDDLRIKVDETLDPKLWDGMALIRRRIVVDLAVRSPWLQDLAAVEPERAEALVRELETVERVELTVLTQEGQIKGHALVIDDRPGYEEVAGALSDIIVAPGAFKPEVRLHKGRPAFVAIEPAHGLDNAEIDIQSLTNLWPFVEPFIEPAYANLRRDNRRLCDDLYRGEYRFPQVPPSMLTEETYPLMLVSRYEIDPLAYPSVMNMVARGRLSELDRMRRNMHLPLPNLHRRYLAVDVNSGGSFVAGWGVDRTSLYVAAADYPAIAGVLGGADLDDGLMVLPFIDWDMAERTLIWRQPNQPGEWWLLEGWGGLALPEEPVFGDSRALPTRIDLQENRPPAIPADEPPMEWDAAVARLLGNKGAIGIFANYMMMAMAVDSSLLTEEVAFQFKRTSFRLPCSFESIIDATVKDGRNVAPQIRQVKALMKRLCQDYAIPAVLLPRAPSGLRRPVQVAENHWLDAIHNELVTIYEELDNERLTFKDLAHLPIRELMAHGNLERGEGAYRYFFGLVDDLRVQVIDANGELVDEPDWPAIGKAFAESLVTAARDVAEQDAILLGILAYAGVRGTTDLPCFMATTAAKAFTAMAAHGVARGDVPSLAVQVQHVWFNRLQQERQAAGQALLQRMAQVPEQVRATYKAGVNRLLDGLQAVIVEGRNVLSAADECLLGLLPKDSLLPDGEWAVLAGSGDEAEGSLHLRLALVNPLSL